mmetsp:Transcript_29323/g.57395  ORF Transcript_29323/g.57395 Transcript_29323/m.57395 type:complete len:217 (+) Transcript_29323:458-1108(+)
MEQALVELPLTIEDVAPGNKHDQCNFGHMDQLVHPALLTVLIQHWEAHAGKYCQEHGPSQHEPALPLWVYVFDVFRRAVALQQQMVHLRVLFTESVAYSLRNQEGDDQPKDIQLQVVQCMVHSMMFHALPPHKLIHRRDSQEDQYSYKAKCEGHHWLDFFIESKAGLVLQVAACYDAGKRDEMRTNTAECRHPEMVVAPEESNYVGNDIKNKHLDR